MTYKDLTGRARPQQGLPPHCEYLGRAPVGQKTESFANLPLDRYITIVERDWIRQR